MNTVIRWTEDQLVEEISGLDAQLTEVPAEVGPADVKALRNAGVSRQGVLDLIDVVSAFNIITRIADALEFDIPSWPDFLRGAKVMKKRGYK